MNKVSIIIPSRNEPYLQKTIDSLLNSAHGDIEIIVILDGYWPNPIIKDNLKVILIHNSESKGMRASINAGARIAKGKYILKCDAHCCFDEGFDTKLIKDCEYDWTIVPRRYGLDVDKWERTDKFYDFEYIEKDILKGKKWPEYEVRTDGKSIVDLMTSQGSCWFMHKDRFFNLGGLDEINYGGMGREAQEVCLKSWLSGGKYLLNRNTWYAHWSKPKEYVLSDRIGKEKSVKHATDFWINNKWPLQKHNLQWLIDKFAPVPGWENIVQDEYPEIKLTKKGSNRIVNVVRKQGMNRTRLYKYFASLGFKIGAEVGVQRGRNAWAMLENIPGLKLYLIDPYKDNSDTQRQWGIEKNIKSRKIAHERLKNRDVEFIEDFSLNASLKIPDNFLDFVYIDAEHSYDYVMMDIQLWSRRVRAGGIVSGHDYFFMKTDKCKVEDAVNDFARMHNITIYITDGKANEIPGDKYPSWFFIKQ